MCLKNEISLAEIITIIFTVIGGGFALWQWNKNSIVKRASYYNDAFIKMREDEDIVYTLHMIDYDTKKWYPFDSQNDPEIERKVDKTFGYIDYLCYLRDRKLISKKEFRNIEYKIIRIGFNSSALDYLYNLYHFSKANGTAMSFSNLLEYLDYKNMINDAFYNRDSNEYIHYLNF